LLDTLVGVGLYWWMMHEGQGDRRGVWGVLSKGRYGAMPIYVNLIKFTDQGIKNAKDTVQRAAAFRGDVERRGGKLLGIYWTQGQYDIVTTIQAPDEQTAMAAALAVASLGNVRTETLRAFDESEMQSIIQKV